MGLTNQHQHLTEIKDQCKFEHPGRKTNANARNSFAPLQNNPGPQGGPNSLRGTNQSASPQ